MSDNLKNVLMKTVPEVRCYTRQGRLLFELPEENELDTIWETEDKSSKGHIAKFRAMLQLAAGSKEEPCILLKGPRFELCDNDIIISKVGNKHDPKECEELKLWGTSLGALMFQLEKAGVPHRVEPMNITEPSGRRPIPVTLIIDRTLVDELDKIFPQQTTTS